MIEWFGKASLGELKSKESVIKRVVGREFQLVKAKETAGPEGETAWYVLETNSRQPGGRHGIIEV